MAVKKKPTMKEVAKVIIELTERTNFLRQSLIDLEKAFSLYVDMNKDTEKFTKFIDNKVKEWKELNDPEGNGKADKPNLQGDTDGESSGTKGVRKKK